MTAEHYNENHLYTIASQLSRAVENDTQEVVADKAKDFVDSIDKLGIQNIVRKKIGHDF